MTKNKSNKAQFAIFDCDGVLIDSMSAWVSLEESLCKKAGIKYTLDISRKCAPMSLEQVAGFFHNELGAFESVEECVSTINSDMLLHYRFNSTEKDGALDFVKTLHKRGVKCAVASASSQEFLKAGLARCGFMPYIEAIVSCEDVGKSKTFPDVYDHAAFLIGASRDNSIVFEDSAYALSTLKMHGFTTVGICDSKASASWEQICELATYPIHSFKDLHIDDIFFNAEDEDAL